MKNKLLKKKKQEQKAQRELVRFNNIEAWSGEWFCPNCQKAVKAYWCECGWAYFNYKDPGFSERGKFSHIYFYSRDSILKYSLGRKYFSNIILCALRVQKDGKIEIENDFGIIPEKKEFISKFVQYPIL